MFTRKRSAFCKQCGTGFDAVVQSLHDSVNSKKKRQRRVQAIYRCQEAHNGFVVLMHMPETGSLAKAVCTHTLLKIAKRLIHHYDLVFTSFEHH